MKKTYGTFAGGALVILGSGLFSLSLGLIGMGLYFAFTENKTYLMLALWGAVIFLTSLFMLGFGRLVEDVHKIAQKDT